MASKAQLIEDLKEFAEELGKTPTAREMNNVGPWSARTYHNRFGSWNNALEKAKLEKNEEYSISKEELIEDLKDFAEELGKSPTHREMVEEGPWSADPYTRQFGSWNKALEMAGLEKNEEYPISKEELIEDLKDFAEELGKTPTYIEMKEFGPWGATTYEKRFGTWNNALDIAGLKKNEEHSISKEELIEDLKEIAEELGKTPTQKEVTEHGPRTASLYHKRFGSYNNVLKLAGLDINRETNVSDDRLIADLQKFSEKLDGETPSKDSMRERGPWSSTVYREHFGTWNNALEKAGLEINCLGPSERAGTGEEYYGKGWYKQRKRAIKRDNYRCRICGDDTRPNVHHIKPRREFDDLAKANTLDNLITLCPSHHGRLEGNWKNSTPDEFEEKAKELYT